MSDEPETNERFKKLREDFEASKSALEAYEQEMQTQKKREENEKRKQEKEERRRLAQAELEKTPEILALLKKAEEEFGTPNWNEMIDKCDTDYNDSLASDEFGANPFLEKSSRTLELESYLKELKEARNGSDGGRLCKRMVYNKTVQMIQEKASRDEQNVFRAMGEPW